MVQKNSKTGGYRKRKAMQASRLTAGLLSPALRKQGFTQSEIITRWSEIVGADLADNIAPIKISFSAGRRYDGVLHVRAESAFAPILQHRIPRIIEMVNQYYGYSAIATVTIQQGPLPKKRPVVVNKRLPVNAETTEQVSDIIKETRDSNLKDALQNLGEQMFVDDKKS